MSRERRSIALGLGFALMGLLALPTRSTAGEVDPRQKGYEDVPWSEMPYTMEEMPLSMGIPDGSSGYELCIKDLEGPIGDMFHYCKGPKPPWWQDPAPSSPPDLGDPPAGPVADPLGPPPPPEPDLGDPPTGPLPDPLAGPDDGLPSGQ